MKDQASGKKSKGNLKRKGEGGEKAPSGSGNDGVSQRYFFSLIAELYADYEASFDVIMIILLCSDESVTAGSSDENDDKANQQVLLCV